MMIMLYTHASEFCVTYNCPTLVKFSHRTSATSKSKQAADGVPVLPYDVDLYSWGSNTTVEPVPVQ